MSYKINYNSIEYIKDGEILGIVEFPERRNSVVDINHTFVSERLRGLGIASKLMEMAAEELRKTNRKAIVTCSYARRWFDDHTEYAELLSNREID